MAGDLVLTVRVAEAALRESGDRGGDAAGENAVNVALLCPRPGRAEVLGTTGLVRLRDHHDEGDAADRPPAFAAPILKEVVQGDVALMVHVTDRDRTGQLARFLRAVAGAALGDAMSLVGGAPGVLRHAFTEAAERGSMIVEGGREDERLDVIAVAHEPVLVSADELERLAASGRPDLRTIQLAAPFDLSRPREKGRLAPGRPNGSLVLELSAIRK